MHPLDPLFRPKNAAVIGAMAPGKHGHIVIRHLKKAGFPGGIYPVNPSVGEVEGLKAYASVSQVPAAIDCAMLVVPAEATLGAVRECAAIETGPGVSGSPCEVL